MRNRLIGNYVASKGFQMEKGGLRPMRRQVTPCRRFVKMTLAKAWLRCRAVIECPNLPARGTGLSGGGQAVTAWYQQRAPLGVAGITTSALARGDRRRLRIARRVSRPRLHSRPSAIQKSS